MVGENKRKQRSDKKRDIKPSINTNLKDAIYRLSFVTRIPVKEVCEELCLYSLNNREIRDNISKYIRRDIRLGSTFFNGSREREEMPEIAKRGESERISLRLTQEVHEMVAVLAYGLDCSTSKACAILLDEGMRDFDFINEFAHKYLAENLDEYQLREVERIVSLINEESEEEHTWASVLSAMINTVKRPTTTAKELVGEFLISNWQDK